MNNHEGQVFYYLKKSTKKMQIFIAIETLADLNPGFGFNMQKNGKIRRKQLPRAQNRSHPLFYCRIQEPLSWAKYLCILLMKYALGKSQCVSYNPHGTST